MAAADRASRRQQRIAARRARAGNPEYPAGMDYTSTVIAKPAGSLNVDSVVPYLNSRALEEVKGLRPHLLDKLQKLGSGPKPDAYVYYETVGTPTGNTAGVRAFVDYATRDDVGTLQLLEAVLARRLS